MNTIKICGLWWGMLYIFLHGFTNHAIQLRGVFLPCWYCVNILELFCIKIQMDYFVAVLNCIWASNKKLLWEEKPVSSLLRTKVLGFLSRLSGEMVFLWELPRTELRQNYPNFKKYPSICCTLYTEHSYLVDLGIHFLNLNQIIYIKCLWAYAHRAGDSSKQGHTIPYFWGMCHVTDLTL